VLLERGDHPGEQVDGVGVAVLLADRPRLTHRLQVSLDAVGGGSGLAPALKTVAAALREVEPAKVGGSPRGGSPGAR
jgi:hypothetical protein